MVSEEDRKRKEALRRLTRAVGVVMQGRLQSRGRRQGRLQVAINPRHDPPSKGVHLTYILPGGFTPLGRAGEEEGGGVGRDGLVPSIAATSGVAGVVADWAVGGASVELADEATAGAVDRRPSGMVVGGVASEVVGSVAGGVGAVEVEVEACRALCAVRGARCSCEAGWASVMPTGGHSHDSASAHSPVTESGHSHDVAGQNSPATAGQQSPTTATRRSPIAATGYRERLELDWSGAAREGKGEGESGGACEGEASAAPLMPGRGMTVQLGEGEEARSPAGDRGESAKAGDKHVNAREAMRRAAEQVRGVP